MAKVWVEIVTGVAPDSDETKAALTKAVKEEVEKAMVDRTVAVLPNKYSTKDTDKPKDKRDDYAARAVRIVESLKYKVEAEGKRLYASGKLTVVVELLKLKSKDEKGELAGQSSKSTSNVEIRGAFDSDFVKASEKLLDELVGPMVKKSLDSQFEKFAKDHNLPLD